jgi:hypothetical protein
LGEEFDLIWGIVGDGVDDKFVFMFFVKGERHVQLLVFRVSNKASGHGGIMIKG